MADVRIWGGPFLTALAGLAGCAGVIGGPPVDSKAFCAEVDEWSAERVAFEEEVLARVNDVRSRGANCGSAGTFGPAPALELDDALTCAARVHSVDMAERSYFDHTDPDGVGFSERFEQAGYDWSAAGENIAAGYENPKTVVEGWLESDAHCANLMSSLFEHTGIGYYEDPGSTYLYYWTQVFAAPE